MPTLSMFLGILIKMNWKDFGKHSSPHFHAFYNEYEAVFAWMAKSFLVNFQRNKLLLLKPGYYYTKMN